MKKQSPRQIPENFKGEFQLPLSHISSSDVCGVLFSIHPTEELWNDAILKLETWIVNYAEEQVAPLRDAEICTDEEIEKLKARIAVVSPITVALYAHFVQTKEFAAMTEAEKEKFLLSSHPDRFKVRFRSNAADRNSRDVTEAELAIAAQKDSPENGDGTYSMEDVLNDLFASEKPAYIREAIQKRKEAG